ncbi:OLC1v1020413C1 [Oldenlandia corymbosa var. corymbosa]|uniref:OLC1v1020413C1 n=1 Tax=Oldenlandia corymbosa var. corymbosa TaxID=529605 RepID=A0AAV1EGE7_OLDCO|nr:OLC1v1020413C1 [Oldenlandia corymbosa var. corymbosa]
MSEFFSSLPEDLLITDVLARLPAKSVGRFRCVSKPWRSLLSSSHFIKTHLKFHIFHDPEKLIFTSPAFCILDPDSLHVITLPVDDNNMSKSSDQRKKDSNVSKEVQCPHTKVTFETTPMSNRKYRMNISRMNEESVSSEVPCPLVHNSFRMKSSCHGLVLLVDIYRGYDHVNDDYKIVALSYDEPGRVETSVNVYSAKMESWKRLEVSSLVFDHGGPHIANGVFVNGRIHCLACHPETRAYPVIAAFNLARDEFERVQPPTVVHEHTTPSSELDGSTRKKIKLAVLGGSLAVAVDSNNGMMDIWVMKEYPLQASWIKLTSINYTRFGPHWSCKPMCLLRDDEIVMRSNCDTLVAYNFSNGVWRNIKVEGIPDQFGDVMTHTDTLLSP